MDEKQIKELSVYLKNMDELLEKILHAQFGIEDKKWINAISTIEDGFSMAVKFIGETKGILKKHPKILTNEDIKRILSD